MALKLGLVVGYWGRGPNPFALDQIKLAEDLGYDSCWTAEAWGSDAFTPLAWYGAQTSRIKLGTDIVQLSARTPAATAMAAMTLDHLSGGRHILGLGASGPQVVEGWYGQPYPKPLARTREYIDIIRKILAREEPVANDGPHYPLPYPGGAGLGKPLKSIVHPLRADLPIYLAAEGPKNVALAGEIADGWLAIYYSPKEDAFYRAALQEGFDRPGARRGWDDFEVAVLAPVIETDDIEAGIDQQRPILALYIGGMGAPEQNFHLNVYARMGYEAECKVIQDLYLEGKKDEAAAAVPRQLILDTALIGPKEKIRDDLAAWDEGVATTLLIAGSPDTLRTMAELCL